MSIGRARGDSLSRQKDPCPESLSRLSPALCLGQQKPLQRKKYAPFPGPGKGAFYASRKAAGKASRKAAGKASRKAVGKAAGRAAEG